MPSGLYKKLLVKPGYRAALLNAPAGYPPAGEELPEGTRFEPAAEAGEHALDFVLGFVASVAELGEVGPRALAAVKPGGVLWLAYPKKTGKIKTDISRDAGWDAMRTAGWQGVALVALDDTWSAMRFRPI